MGKRSKQTKVDPKTREPSTEETAVPVTTYRSQEQVDPVTGKKSNMPGSIQRGTFHARQPVDPITGKPSTDQTAIKRGTFNARKYRKRKQSDAKDTISKGEDFNRIKRKKVDSLTEKQTNREIEIPPLLYGEQSL